jgi:hypothetical protein
MAVSPSAEKETDLTGSSVGRAAVGKLGHDPSVFVYTSAAPSFDVSDVYVSETRAASPSAERDTDQPKYSAPATLALTPLLKDTVGELGHEPPDSW